MVDRTASDEFSASEKAGISDCHVGLIGHGIQLSRTPKMHVEEGAALGLRYRYDLIDTETQDEEMQIEDLLDQVEVGGYRGVNITHPYKKAVIPFLGSLSEAAQAVHAVNTVLFRNGKRYGHNTDYWGFAEAFKRYLSDVASSRILLIGAGGAGAAVANALVDHSADHLAIFDRDHSFSSGLVDALHNRVGENRVSLATDLAPELSLADGFVNATPMGMASHPGLPVPVALLRPSQWVADINYFPLETELLASARAIGCKTMDGSGMAVFQAVRAFEIFTGLEPNPERMRATFDTFNH